MQVRLGTAAIIRPIMALLRDWAVLVARMGTSIFRAQLLHAPQGDCLANIDSPVAAQPNNPSLQHMNPPGASVTLQNSRPQSHARAHSAAAVAFTTASKTEIAVSVRSGPRYCHTQLLQAFAAQC